jgi:ADP-L-glycero-D-manno-heptose 6-epimerase
VSKVLITGSKGFIGDYLINYLSKRGYELEYFDKEYLKDHDWKSSLIKKLDRINADTILHVGACSDTISSDVQSIMLQNYEATKVVSDWCDSRERKLIYSSSAANYGVEGSYPSNLYGWSKYAAENYVLKSGGVALRYFNVYGPGEENKGIMASVLYQSYSKQIIGQEILLFPGKPSRDFVYIDDVASANLHALVNFSDLVGNFYDVCTGESRLFENVLDLAGISYSYTEELDVPKGYQFYTRGNPNKWMKNWQPRYSLEQGVSEYLNYLRTSLGRRD